MIHIDTIGLDAGETQVPVKDGHLPAYYPRIADPFNADYRPSYRATDAIEAWNRMLAWFRTYGAAPAT